MKAMNVVRRYGAKLIVAGALASVSGLALADSNIWDAALAALTGLVAGVTAIGGVIITLAVTAAGFFFKSMIKRAP